MPLKSNQLDPVQRAKIHKLLAVICGAYNLDFAVLFVQGAGNMEALSAGMGENAKLATDEIIGAVRAKAEHLAEEAATRN